MGRFLRALVVTVAAAAQTPPAAKPEAVIRGVVRDAVTGIPLVGAEFRDVWSMTPRATTDAQGRYTLRGLAAGLQRISVYVPSTQVETIPIYRGATRIVNLRAGQELNSVDFALVRLPEISGRVLDHNKEPAPGIQVFLVAREYSLGELRYVYSITTQTNDQGEYVLRAPHPGRSYLVLASRRKWNVPALSDAPADPKLRKPATVPTYYPGTPSIEGAQPMLLRACDRREGVDITLLRGPAFCVEGVLKGPRGPQAFRFEFAERQPANGASGGSSFFISTPRGVTGSDGRFRMCDLPPAEYQLTVLPKTVSAEMPETYGTLPVAITDSDVRNASAVPQAQIPVPIDVAWEGEAPEPPLPGKMSLRLIPLSRPPWSEEMKGATIPFPGTALFSGVLAGEYAPRISDVPSIAYIKDILYAGRSILYEPLRVGSAIGNATLRIVLARDGGTLGVKVSDKDGNAVPDTPVAVLPAAAPTEMALADSLITGQTDQDGIWTSAPLAPGKYYVLALTTAADKSPECIGKLLLGRNHAKEVELAPNASVQVTLSPRAID